MDRNGVGDSVPFICSCLTKKLQESIYEATYILQMCWEGVERVVETAEGRFRLVTL